MSIATKKIGKELFVNAYMLAHCANDIADKKKFRTDPKGLSRAGVVNVTYKGSCYLLVESLKEYISRLKATPLKDKYYGSKIYRAEILEKALNHSLGIEMVMKAPSSKTLPSGEIAFVFDYAA